MIAQKTIGLFIQIVHFVAFRDISMIICTSIKKGGEHLDNRR